MPITYTTLDSIKATVAEYLSMSVSTNLERPIYDTIKHLSSLFHLRFIDDSLSTVVGQNYIAHPTDCKKVLRIAFDDEEVEKLDDLSNLQNCIDADILKWYEFEGAIYFTIAPTSVQSVTVHYWKKFTVPTAVISTDVPSEMLELVYVGACMRYVRQMYHDILRDRATYPDNEPEDLRLNLEDWRKQYDDLILIYQIEDEF